MASRAAPAVDRLSQLSDDILTHILSFAPSREAARATALSRRWRRPLWLDTGAVNVDYRSYAGGGGVRRRMVDDADHAYAFLCSRGHVPKKLSVVMPDDAIVCAARGGMDDEYEHEEEEEEEEEEADGVEDPRLDWVDNGGLPSCTLPFAVLRVLELTGYDLQPYSDGRRQLAFPHLEAMRLRRCRTELPTLQQLIAAAPKLADVRLESLTFVDYHDVYYLYCEAATTLVMENCGVLLNNLHIRGCNVRLNAPCLLRFRYTNVNAIVDDTSFRFWWQWDAPRLLDDVHLEVHSAGSAAASLRRSILPDASDVRFLKLTAYSIADLDVEGLPFFHSLERLEIEELCGWCVQRHGTAAKAILNLLGKSVCLRELRLKFSWQKHVRKTNLDPEDEMAAIADFPQCRSVDIDEDEADCCKGLEDLHGHFCGGSTLFGLRRVVVEFDAEELTCFQVRLVRFLAKSAVDLEELIIDGGKGYDSSRMNRKVMKWQKQHKIPPPPHWPLPLSEFPPLEAPPTPSDEEADDDDVFEMKEDKYHRNYKYSSEEEDEEDDNDISPRHYMHHGRKKKKGGSHGCFSVNSKAKGLITQGPRRARAIYRHRQRCVDWEEEGDVSGESSLETVSPPTVGPTQATPAEPWSAPLLYEFPLLRRPTPRRPPISLGCLPEADITT